MYTLCASAMSTVSMSIVGAYMTMIEPRYVVTALVLNLFGGFIIASIVNPYKVEKDEDILEVQEGGEAILLRDAGRIHHGWLQGSDYRSLRCSSVSLR